MNESNSMAIFKNFSLIFSLVTFLSLFTVYSQSQSHSHRHHNYARRIQQVTTPFVIEPIRTSYGTWVVLQKNIGVSAMHMQLLYNNKVVIFDRTDFGPSNLSLASGICRFNDEAINPDCTAHSLLYDVPSNTFRPLFVQTDVWCSSGAVNSNGTLVQTGGYHAGNQRIRLFTPCDDASCDWVELPETLALPRWYSSTQSLPDGRVIVVGGRRAFNYEFFPKDQFSLVNVFNLTFLKETTDFEEENNLYPFLHLLPDGNLFIFANRRSILLDYVGNRVLREFPVIPGAKRSYPSTGSSVLLPIRLAGGTRLPEVEVMICGGAAGGSFLKAAAKIFLPASKTCGRLKLSDPEPTWVMEIMPMARVMPDMLLLPTGDVIIINGASKGTAGWESAVEPVLDPVLYMPTQPERMRRFSVLHPTTIPRMYHSAATLLPDGKILVGGSNPHVLYVFSGVRYPTDLSLEAFSPPYMAAQYDYLRPNVSSSVVKLVSYGQEFSITFTLNMLGLVDPGEIMVTMISPSFSTHSFAMNQRLLVLDVANVAQSSFFEYIVTVFAPPTSTIAPPGYYMLFVVHAGIPGQSTWIKVS